MNKIMISKEQKKELLKNGKINIEAIKNNKEYNLYLSKSYQCMIMEG